MSLKVLSSAAATASDGLLVKAIRFPSSLIEGSVPATAAPVAPVRRVTSTVESPGPIWRR